MSGSLPRRSSSPRLPAGADRSATMQTALDALLSGTAADPVRRALGLDALDRQLRPLLPPALAPHVRLANVADGRLVMLVDSPVWHARLRLAAPELLDAARSVGLEVREIAIKASREPLQLPARASADRKSTRLNSSHVRISYAVFCLKKKKTTTVTNRAAAPQYAAATSSRAPTASTMSSIGPS